MACGNTAADPLLNGQGLLEIEQLLCFLETSAVRLVIIVPRALGVAEVVVPRGLTV